MNEGRIKALTGSRPGERTVFVPFGGGLPRVRVVPANDSDPAYIRPSEQRRIRHVQPILLYDSTIVASQETGCPNRFVEMSLCVVFYFGLFFSLFRGTGLGGRL